jgi:hypothetical protein
MPDFIIKDDWNGTTGPDSQALHITVSGGPARSSEQAPASRSADNSAETSCAPLLVRIDAPFYGDPAPVGRAGVCDGLWDYEVCEIFLVGSDSQYLELEFGPHGHYLALLLDGPRKILSHDNHLQYHAERHEGRWWGNAVVPAALVPDPIDRLNLFAIHGTGADRRYLAWSAVPGNQPDFHQPQSFPRWPNPRSHLA